MPSTARLIDPRNIAILLGILVLCFAAGAWCDLPLSQALYNPASTFGQTLAAYGQAPGALVISAAGTLLAISHKRERRPLSAVLGVVANAAALIYLTFAPVRYFGQSLVVRAAIALLLTLAVGALTTRLARHARPRDLRRLAYFLIFVVVAENLLVTCLKELWGRPRMRMLAATPEAAFQPWWAIASGQREALMAHGIPAEEFRSFPSGHTASAACAMAVVALPAMRPDLARWRGRLFWLSTLVPAAVACSRIVMGAHFLSDVAGGFAATFLVILVGSWLFYRNRIPASGERKPEPSAPAAQQRGQGEGRTTPPGRCP